MVFDSLFNLLLQASVVLSVMTIAFMKIAPSWYVQLFPRAKLSQRALSLKIGVIFLSPSRCLSISHSLSYTAHYSHNLTDHCLANHSSKNYYYCLFALEDGRCLPSLVIFSLIVLHPPVYTCSLLLLTAHKFRYELYQWVLQSSKSYSLSHRGDRRG